MDSAPIATALSPAHGSLAFSQNCPTKRPEAYTFQLSDAKGPLLPRREQLLQLVFSLLRICTT